MEDNQILSATATIGREHYATRLQARTHVLTGDEPAEVGGTDTGPRPGDFVRMALASCQAITLRMYADRKQYPVEQIMVTVSNGPSDGKTTYTSDIVVTGALTADEQQRMIQVARRCPVHKILTNPIEILTNFSIRSAQL